MSRNFGPAANRHVIVDRCQLASPLMRSETDSNVGATADIRDAIVRLDIFENMFSPTLTGQVQIQDSVNLSSFVPLLGFEVLRIKFHSMNRGQRRTYEVPLAVYNQTNRTTLNAGTEKYTLGLASPELIASTGRQVSFVCENRRIEDIIREIVVSPNFLSSRKSFVDIEPTATPTTLVIPYMSPLDAIHLLTLQGRSASNETNYVFFETLEGFHFTSFRRAIEYAKTKPIPRISLRLAGGQTSGNDPEDIAADQIELVSGFDHLYLLSRGYFASTTYALDVLSGKYEVELSSSGHPDFIKKPSMNGSSGRTIYPAEYGRLSNPTARMFLVPTTHISAANTALTSVDPSIKSNFIAQTIDGRNRELLGLQTRTVRVVVSGAPELNVGKLVHITVPNPVNNGVFGRQEQDTATGVYMIISAKHSLIRTPDSGFSYETTFEAVTDSTTV